ncbi:MAG: NAD(P)-binding domain-containing protein, partial [Desulfobacula sp.]|nr:NAD(P)-binding domain-containing protein [Desulfobacula sp.]
MEPGKTSVGFIGLGVMGQSMATHILNAGYKLHVYTRTKHKAENIISKGAVWEDTVSKLSAKCDVIITIVGFPADVEEVYLGDNGILNHAKKESFVIDMTTSSPDLAIKIYKQAKEKGIKSLD